jgi:hypothetical protein
MLSTEHPSGQTGWTPYPGASRLIPWHHMPRAVLRCTSHLPPRLALHTAEVGNLHAVALSSTLASSSASTSLHWTAASRFAHVTTVCFMCFRCMLHILQCLYTYAASVCFKRFNCFQMYVVSGLSGCCICCTGYTRTLQVYVFKCFGYFKRMLQVFYLDVAYVAAAIHGCCKCMFQIF